MGKRHGLVALADRFAAGVPSAGQRLGIVSLAVAAGMCMPNIGKADEGGVSFWVPGFFGSLAATPQQPGFTIAEIYYHTSVSAGGSVAFARDVPVGNLTANLRGSLNANLKADANLGFLAPSYVFATPFFGGQAAVAVLFPFGRTTATLNANVAGSLGPFSFARSGALTDSIEGYGDVIPQFAVRWNSGVNNWMTYVTGDIPVGLYDSKSLANLGLGHGAIDGGGGYTYFDPKSGRELSGGLGFTYNLENDATQYRNGVDMHFDFGTSQFLTKQLLIGAVGYAYQQISCDSGARDRVGCFESRVFGVGPQIGYIIPFGDAQGYLNLKAYKEFGAENRPEGWNAWVTFALSPAPPPRP
jgi:hypothetical protein